MGVAESVQEIEKLIDAGKLGDADGIADKLLESNPSCKILILKSQILLQSGKLDECQNYANKALKIAIDEGKRLRIAESCKIISMAYFQGKDYENSLKFITIASKYIDSNDNEITTLKSVIELKFKKSNKINDDELANLELEIEKLSLESLISSDKKVETTTSKADVKPESTETNNGIITTEKIRHDWFDTGKSIELSIYVKRINNETVKITFNSTSIDVSFKDNDNQSYNFTIPQLYSTISTTESSFKVYGTKLEIILIKDNQCHWSKLENDNENQKEELLSIPKEEANPSLSYPSSSKNNKDWSKFGNDDEDEDDEDQDPEAFFRKLYSGADEDARRAMMKSFMESNGTSLSTDWKDVGSREVKPYKDGDDGN